MLDHELKSRVEYSCTVLGLDHNGRQLVKKLCEIAFVDGKKAGAFETKKILEEVCCG
jgi:hypothetical protein